VTSGQLAQANTMGGPCRIRQSAVGYFRVPSPGTSGVVDPHSPAQRDAGYWPCELVWSAKPSLTNKPTLKLSGTGCIVPPTFVLAMAVFAPLLRQLGNTLGLVERLQRRDTHHPTHANASGARLSDKAAGPLYPPAR
jgi:hypothetical protein